MKLNTLAERVRFLVDRYWGGSVNAAAVHIGVPQQTLHRIATGKTPNPRIAVVARIAEVCRVTPDWLVSGKGVSPPLTDEHGRAISGTYFRFRNILARIGVSPSLHLALDDLCSAPLWMALGMIDGVEEPFSPAMNAALEACATCTEAWSDMLEAAVDQQGAEAVLKSLAESEPLIALGHTSFGMDLWFSRQRRGIAGHYKAFLRKRERRTRPKLSPRRGAK